MTRNLSLKVSELFLSDPSTPLNLDKQRVWPAEKNMETPLKTKPVFRTVEKSAGRLVVWCSPKREQS